MAWDPGNSGELMFLSGIKNLSDEGLQAAILMKHAGRENKRLQALAAAWQLKEAEYYGRLANEIYIAKYRQHEQYCKGTVEGTDTLVEVDESPSKTKVHLDGIAALNHELYNEHIVSLDTMWTQLQQLEKKVIVHCQSLRNSDDEHGASFDYKYAAPVESEISGDDSDSEASADLEAGRV
ncbi:hypothetical protein SCLCIDRAFT_31172 [Scleroderma citrinum Foug A]|uniref:Uncharacterized protein n=1 Tax=Scleroderma citrinum Foug A TaxID=1036808 RepID=A0A0C2ZNV9_9AGAM|nr:hypothetical protein SCLCIDRAFT_31172 [Scleroderma citrinum Foug A]